MKLLKMTKKWPKGNVTEFQKKSWSLLFQKAYDKPKQFLKKSSLISKEDLEKHQLSRKSSVSWFYYTLCVAFEKIKQSSFGKLYLNPYLLVDYCFSNESSYLERITIITTIQAFLS